MTFFQINYCDYNHSNMDCDMINRPNGSGDYLFLYFLTPMKVYFGQEMTIAQKCNLRRAAVADAFSGGRPALMNGC